jgi:mono/diheme cytochrome c family protein
MFRIVTMLCSVLLAAGLTAPAALAAEKDPVQHRVPKDQLAAAQALKNPVPSTPANIAKGKALYNAKGTCFTCHGAEGKGDGIVGSALNPSPRNFHNPVFWKNRTDGELMWILKHGSAGTGMVTLVPSTITEVEGWKIITYLHTFNANSFISNR